MSESRLTRRDMMKNFAGAAALFGLPLHKISAEPNQLPPESLFGTNPDSYWDRLRSDQFLMPNVRAFLNTGSLGVTPRPVFNAVVNYLEKAAELNVEALQVEQYPRWGYEALDEERLAIAEFIGCHKDELAITHNATEAMSIIAGGMPLPRGTEVLLTDQEHPSGTGPWKLREIKGELKTRTVNLPLPPKSPEQLVDIIISAIGPKTRVLSFSGIMSPTGLLMPIREICDAARERGVITVVDGAHMTGQVPVKIDDMHCDYFAGSPHKWLFSPAGSGVLYISESRLDEHYPVIATAGWDDKAMKAGRFMRFGTNNRAIIEGFMAGLEFAKSIGPDRIYQRIHELALETFNRARELPYVTMLTPEDDRMFGSLVTFRINLPEQQLALLWQRCTERRIWTTGDQQLRVSTHIHTRYSDLDLFFETLREVAG